MNLLRELGEGLRLGEQAVLNTSSLSSLVITNNFDILSLFFDRVYIPQAVRGEFSSNFRFPTGLSVATLTPQQTMEAESLELGAGESQAIILARDKQSPLIIDERTARTVAKSQGVTVIGSVGLVRRAFIDCMIDSASYFARISAFASTARANPSIIGWARLARKP